MGSAVLLRPVPGVRPGGRPTFLGAQESRQRNRPCRMALRVRSNAQVCRAAPNSLRYAAFRQGARNQFLKSLSDALQTFRSSPMQKGNPEIPTHLASHRLIQRSCPSLEFAFAHYNLPSQQKLQNCAVNLDRQLGKFSFSARSYHP